MLSKGYKFIEKNWHFSKNAEIDLIMQDDETLVFVEVKKRSSLNYGHPFEAITKTKMQNIKLAARGYLAQNGEKLNFKSFRIDGIAVLNENIEHLENIF